MPSIIYEAQPTVDVVCPTCGLVDRVFDRSVFPFGTTYETALARHNRSEAHKEASK